jgi:two-component system response regulator FlrC
VAAGRFREDLFYRLNVFPITLPPLRERRDDILPLATHLLLKHLPQGRAIPQFSTAAQQHLLCHDWPGNVRELDNLIQRALILLENEVIDSETLCFEESRSVLVNAQETSACTPGSVAPAGRLPEDLRSLEEQMILDALEQGRGSRKRVAQRLGISERTLRYKIARMREAGISVPR